MSMSFGASVSGFMMSAIVWVSWSMPCAVFCGDGYGSFGDTHIGYEVYFVVDSDDVGGGELLL